jgi:CHAT domain-containing protein/Tfp pilus assembly protein PilF
MQSALYYPLSLFLSLMLLFAPVSIVRAIEPSPPTQTDKDIRVLEPGKPIEQMLKSSESHSYHINLMAGQFSHIVVEQKGIDVVVVLFDPNGKQLFEVDSPNGIEGPEPLQMIVETTGNYLLEVRSLEKGKAPGRYEIRIEELRQATTQDRDRIAAQMAFAEAMQLQMQGTAESLRKAVTNFDKALSLYRVLGDRGKEVQTLNIIGSVYRFLGEYQKALDYFSQALPLVRRLGDRRAEVSTLNSIGLVYSAFGENQKALEYLQQALPLFQTAGERRSQASTLNTIGLVYSNLEEHQKALEYYSQALALWRAIGDRGSEGTILSNIGVIYYKLGENQKALEYYNQALSIRHAVGDRRGEAITLNNIGLVYRDRRENQKALEYFSQALPLLRATGDRRGEAHSLSSIGLLYNNLGENQKAVEYFSQALPLLRAVGERKGEAYTLYCFAKANLNLGNENEARRQIEESLELIEYLRFQAPTQELRASYFANVRDYYGFYIDLLMKLHKEDPSAGHNAIALNVSEKSRARVLLELLSESKVDIREGVDPQLLEKERSLNQRFNIRAEKLIQLKNSKSTEEQVKAAEKEIEQLITELQELKAQIRNKSPRYAALTQPQPLNLKEIQQLLDKETLLLEYVLGEEKSYLWLVAQDSISSYVLPKREEIDNQARRVYELLTAREPNSGETDQQYNSRVTEADAHYWKEASSLSRMVLGPVANLLEKKRLVVVADSSLQYLPFSALPRPAAEGERENGTALPLITEHEIVNLPSASVLGLIRSELAGRGTAPKMIAVLADPVYSPVDPRTKQNLARTPVRPVKQNSSDESPERIALVRSIREVTGQDGKQIFDRLIFSGREAAAISSLVPAGKRKQAVGFEASRKTATSDELGQYRFLHFATHGILNSSHPELSGIVLSLIDETGRPQDGFLRLHDIYNLRIPADLVVLSACRTGLGKEIKGEGLVGLTRGFMYAGASRVAASLWKVDDSATAELMKQFYQGMLGKEQLTPSAALRAAQLSMLKKRNREAPYYWAAFSLQGDWR